MQGFTTTFTLATIIGLLSQYVLPCIALGVIQYFILIKYSRYKLIIPTVSGLYGIVKSILFLSFVYMILRTIGANTSINIIGYFLYSLCAVLIHFSVFITVGVVTIMYKKGYLK